MRRLTLILLVLLAVGATTDASLYYVRYVSAADAPTPSPGAMTIYQVDNPGVSGLLVQHDFSNAQATPVYSFSDTVPASASTQYHVRDMTQIPSPFEGQVVLSASQPFSAEVVPYDYPPTSTPTNSPTATATATASATNTATRTVTATATNSPTATRTATQTQTPTATSTPTPFRIVLPISK